MSAAPASVSAAVPRRRGAVHVGVLGPLLCWAIVYADIGTSVYYVPGILFRDVGTSAASFVLATSIVFVFLAEKYADISARYAGGGGVVSVATDAFGPRAGALGGMLILVDYFLTAAISAVSGFAYLATLFPVLGGAVAWLAVVGLALLGILNWIGIRESASVSAAIGTAAFVVLIALVVTASANAEPQHLQRIGDNLAAVGQLPLADAVIGFSGAWLAFSGLESLAQVSPAMAAPRRRTAVLAMGLVVVAILATSPLLTAFSTTLLDPRGINPDALQSELAFAVGGSWLRVLVVVTASALLLFAANTALVGAYHIFCALADGGFLPGILLARSQRFGTPTLAIALAVLMPIAVLGATGGDIHVLGGLYAFGLLGAFAMSSVSLDRVRMAEGQRGILFALGIATTVAVLVAWLTNLVAKPSATLFGGGLTAVMMLAGLAYQRGLWHPRAAPSVMPEEAERIAAARPAAAEILTLAEALELAPAYQPKTLVCVRTANQRLLEEAAAHVAGRREVDVAVLFIDEVPGLFVPRDTDPSREAREVLEESVAWLNAQGCAAIPVWRIARDAGEAIADAAARLEVDAILIGTSQRGMLWHMLRGNVLTRLTSRVPARTRLVIVG
jgi:amino acid transporter/nucleotide-binding universal stress UspA family protein